MHVELSVVAGADQCLKGHLLVLAYILGSEHVGLIFLDVLFCSYSYLQSTDFVVSVDQLAGDISGVYHKLDCDSDRLVSNGW